MKADIAVIGGGYYGCASAIELRAARPDLSVVVVEQEAEPFGRASSTNQGQLHAGYMYSKFPDLARECVEGAEEFVKTYGEAVNQDVLTYYGVHRDSEISAAEYEAFCRRVGLPLRSIAAPPKDFFGPSLANVYETAEKTFDNGKLGALMARRLSASGVELITSFTASKVQPAASGLNVQATDGRSIEARAVFNATFADSNTLHEQSNIPKLPLDHAVFLHFLVALPEKYAKMGLIVVRGMYAALAPVADSQASHIFASGQFRVARSSHIDAPSEAVTAEDIADRYKQAVGEASNYMPALRSAKLVGHTVGTRTNYVDPVTGIAASRAVVLKDYGNIAGYHCVFGGKVTCLPEIVNPVRQIAQEIKG